MARKDQIDLIKEFRQEQRDNDYILLTTYCFDPFLFDTYLLNNLRWNNPNSEIIVLIDAEQYEKSYENFTDISGKDYHLIPIYVNKGVFHPKMFLFLSTLNEKLTSYIGSSNLTLPGLTKNAELISKTEYDLKEEYSDINQLLEFLNGLKSDFIFERKVLETLENIIQHLSLFEGSEIVNSEFKILTNFNNGIIPQLIQELEINDFEEIIMLAPFLSSKPKILEKLKNSLFFDKATLILPKGNHNLDNVDSYMEFALNNSLDLKIKEGEFLEDSARRFHSKILYLKGSIDYLLIGSPNLTISALLETANKGNLECSILYKDINPDEILKNVNSTLITNIENISCPIKSTFTKYSLLKVFSADYNNDNGYLVIETEKINDVAILTIKIDGSNDINKEFNLDDGKIEIKLTEGIPKEFEIKCGNKCSKRRIFHDRGYFFRNFSRSDHVPIKEVISKFSDFTINTQELLAVLVGMVKISDRADSTENAEKNNPSKLKHRERREIPSTVRNLLSYTVKSLTDSLNFQIIKKSIESDDNPNKTLSKEYKVYERLNRKITPKKLINDIKKINELIIYISEKCTDTNEQLIIQSCFIQLFLRLSKNSVTLDVLNDFRSILEDNMRNIKNNHFSEDSSVMFFQFLLTINYLYNDKESYNFASDVFKYYDILTNENYYKIKNYIKGFKSQFLKGEFDDKERLFNDKKFSEYFVELAVYIFDSKSIEDGLRYILNNLEYENGEFGLILNNLAHNLIYGSDGYPPLFGVSDEFKQWIEALDCNDKTKMT